MHQDIAFRQQNGVDQNILGVGDGQAAPVAKMNFGGIRRRALNIVPNDQSQPKADRNAATASVSSVARKIA